MTLQEAYIHGFLKTAEDNGEDPVDLVRLRSRIDARTLDRFAREDAALQHRKGSGVLKHSLLGGTGGATLGAVLGLLSAKGKDAYLSRAALGSAIGGVVGAGSGVASGALSDLLESIKAKRARREHVEQFLDQMYMPVEQ